MKQLPVLEQALNGAPVPKSTLSPFKGRFPLTENFIEKARNEGRKGDKTTVARMRAHRDPDPILWRKFGTVCVTEDTRLLRFVTPLTSDMGAIAGS